LESLPLSHCSFETQRTERKAAPLVVTYLKQKQMNSR
jgi:hypothetical protein